MRYELVVSSRIVRHGKDQVNVIEPKSDLCLAARLSVVDDCVVPGWNFNPVHTNHLQEISSLNSSKFCHYSCLGVNHETKGVSHITFKCRNIPDKEVAERA